MNRLAEAKGAIELLLSGCYARRESVALIAFRKEGADLLLPPTRSLTLAKRALGELVGLLEGEGELGDALVADHTGQRVPVAVERTAHTALRAIVGGGRRVVLGERLLDRFGDGRVGRDGAPCRSRPRSSC